MLVSLLPSFLGTYSLSMSPLRCKALYIVISFLVLRSICWSSSLVRFNTVQVFVAVTDLFPFANQYPRQAIRLYTDQSGTERIDSFFLSRTIFLVYFGSRPTVREHLVSTLDRSLSPSQKNMLLLVSHTEKPALQSVTRAICYSDTHFIQTQRQTY